MSDPRLTDMLDRLVAGALDDEERGELERTLLVSPAARAEFWRQARFHSLLARWGQESWGEQLAATGASGGGGTAARAQGRAARWLAAAAVVVLTAGVAVMLGRRPAEVADAHGVAVLALQADARWSGCESPPRAGQVLAPGDFELARGVAQVEFFNGTRLLAEGPARFTIIDGMRAFCHAGRLRVHVPPRARGFTIDSPGLTVVDLGTEFALRVEPGAPPEVHVFAGLVEMKLAGRSDQPVPLHAGHAIKLRDRQFEPITVDPQAFPDEQEVARRASEASRAALARWKRSARSLGEDPAALLHLTFEDEPLWIRMIANRAAAARHAPAPADIVGCQWTEGRWPEKRAIQLRGRGDRLRIDVPEPLRAVSLFASLRIDSLPNGYHALLSPDSKAPGTLRWGISGDGRLRLGIAVPSGKPEPNWEVVMSARRIGPAHLGRWITVATTFDGEVVHHCLNGEVIESGRARAPADLRLGAAEIGNWIEATPRNLPAAVDEFLILGRALTPEEIRRLSGGRE